MATQEEADIHAEAARRNERNDDPAYVFVPVRRGNGTWYVSRWKRSGISIMNLGGK